jgi:hypothetical protein
VTVTASTDNPYQSPQTASVDPSAPGKSSEVNWKSILKPSEVNWKSILKRWEILRLPYNLVVGVAGLLVLVLIPFSPVAIVGAIIYGLCANVMYLLGPVTELYLNWFVDVWEHRLVPRWLARFVRSRYAAALLFTAGTLFSVAVTLAVGLAQAFSIALQEQ